MNKLRARSALMSMATAVVALSIAGCSTPPAKAPPGSPDAVRVELEKSMDRIAKQAPHTGHADVKAPESDLNSNSITIRNYQNDAARLLSRVAAARGLKFLINGPEPRLPLFVSIDIVDASLEDFLGAVGHQFGQRADIVLTKETIEIRYRGM